MPAATRNTAIQAAATATRTWQADPTPEAFTAMLAAIDIATELEATNDDIIAAFTALGAHQS